MELEIVMLVVMTLEATKANTRQRLWLRSVAKLLFCSPPTPKYPEPKEGGTAAGPPAPQFFPNEFFQR